MTDTASELRRHRADYGYDGDYRVVPARAVAAVTGGAVAALFVSAARSLTTRRRIAALLAGASGTAIAATATLFVRTTRVGKFEAWARILDDLTLRGDETVLDMGCGRGAVLLAIAKLLPRGRAIGVDIWRADQTDNSADNTLQNAELEGVADRVEVRTADITELPFAADTFDVVTSSLVIHNISDRAKREVAIREAARVLRPGGRLVLVDLFFTNHYAEQLRGLGWTDVSRRGLGWRMWWGPGMGTHVVAASKPR